MKALELSRNTKKTALTVGRSHTVLIIFIIKRSPQKHRLTKGSGNIRCGLLISEIAVNYHYGVNIFRFESFNCLNGGSPVKNKVTAAKSLCINKRDFFIGKIFLYILNKAMASFLRRNPGQKCFRWTVCCITP